MPTKIVTANGAYDLSDVKTLEDLREEISLLKQSLKNDERDLEERLHRMPGEILKASADAVLPAFLNKMIANGTWRILTSGVGILANPFKSKASFGKNIVGSAKRLGFIALAKGAYNLWRSKKNKPKAVTGTEPVKPAVEVNKDKDKDIK